MVDSSQDPLPGSDRHAELNHYEDFEPGRDFRHHWGRTLTIADATSFATDCMLHEPALFNREYAAHLGFPDTPISGLLVFSVVLGMSVEDLSEAGGPFLGCDDVEFSEPIFPNDTLFASSIVLSRRISKSREGYGVVEWKTVGSNQHGTTVISFKRSSLVPCRQPETWRAEMSA